MLKSRISSPQSQSAQHLDYMTAYGAKFEMQLRDDTEAAAKTRDAIENVRALDAKGKSSLCAELPHTEEKYHQEHG
uniref:Uncharacterized protein n=1 Tax=Hyaloperonospora arabidopsidis (strain Emoy2) TaxID=559515 RepID=M4C4Y6_HYAAE